MLSVLVRVEVKKEAQREVTLMPVAKVSFLKYGGETFPLLQMALEHCTAI